MSGQSGKFRYSLQPLLTKLGWEADVLKTELSRLNALLEREDRRIGEVAATVQNTEHELRAMQAAVIQVEKREQLDLYLRQQREALRTRQAERAKVCALCDQVMLQMGNKKRSVKALERHRDRKQAENALDQTRLELKEADGSWLSRLPRKGVS